MRPIGAPAADVIECGALESRRFTDGCKLEPCAPADCLAGCKKASTGITISRLGPGLDPPPTGIRRPAKQSIIRRVSPVRPSDEPLPYDNASFSAIAPEVGMDGAAFPNLDGVDIPDRGGV